MAVNRNELPLEIPISSFQTWSSCFLRSSRWWLIDTNLSIISFIRASSAWDSICFTSDELELTPCLKRIALWKNSWSVCSAEKVYHQFIFPIQNRNVTTESSYLSQIRDILLPSDSVVTMVTSAVLRCSCETCSWVLILAASSFRLTPGNRFRYLWVVRQTEWKTVNNRTSLEISDRRVEHPPLYIEAVGLRLFSSFNRLVT